MAKKPKNQKTVEATKKEVSKIDTTLNDVYKGAGYKGAGLHVTFQDAVIVSNNMSKPYHSLEYNSYSSSVAIQINDAIKEELYKHLASAFKGSVGLELALQNFLEKKIKTLEDGTEVLYASVQWQEVDGTLKLKKALPIEGLESGKLFPFSFIGHVRVGFVFSIQKTFSCYLNQVAIEEVLKQESEYSGLKTSSEYNPTLSVSQSSSSIPESVEEPQQQPKAENSEKKKFSFWK